MADGLLHRCGCPDVGFSEDCPWARAGDQILGHVKRCPSSGEACPCLPGSTSEAYCRAQVETRGGAAMTRSLFHQKDCGEGMCYAEPLGEACDHWKSEAESARAGLDAAAAWIAFDIIGNEIKRLEPLPAALRPRVAFALVHDQRLGWPDIEAADAYLGEWEWT